VGDLEWDQLTEPECLAHRVGADAVAELVSELLGGHDHRGLGFQRRKQQVTEAEQARRQRVS